MVKNLQILQKNIYGVINDDEANRLICKTLENHQITKKFEKNLRESDPTTQSKIFHPTLQPIIKTMVFWMY